MKILARANKKLRGNGKFYTIPEPTKSWFYVTEYDSNGYPIKAKTIGCSGAMPYNYMYGADNNGYENVITKSLKEFEINEGVTNIRVYAFKCCASLKSITIPDSVTSIGREAFRQCYDLTSVTLPDSMTSLGDTAFYQCYGLTSIDLSKVASMGSNTFGGCTNLVLYDFRRATQVPTLSSTSAFWNTPTDKKIVVPDDLYDSWITATNWSSTEYNIVTSIIKASDYEASL